MKTIFCIAIIVASTPLMAKETHTEELLKNGAQVIHYIWTEGLQNPKLEYAKISKQELPKIHGVWSGSYVEGADRVNVAIILKEDGTWISEEFRPDMKDGHWYLCDGMLLLYESKISDKADLASALTKNEGKLRLIIAQVEGGYVELTKEAEQVAP
jgi:hypothetical protein